MTRVPKVLKVQVNNSDVNYYVVKSKVSLQSSNYIEEEKARQFLGIDLVTYNNMIGGRRWADWLIETNNPLSNGIIICKADVVAYYRILTRTESVVNDIVMKPKGK